MSLLEPSREGSHRGDVVSIHYCGTHIGEASIALAGNPGKTLFVVAYCRTCEEVFPDAEYERLEDVWK